MTFFILAKKIRAHRYPIAILLIINPSSIFSTLNVHLAILFLGLPNLCINSSESLANISEIDK